MNQSNLIKLVANETGVSLKDTRATVSSALDRIAKALRKGDVVRTTLGVFSVVKRAARVGRNPQTGAPVKIKAGKRARFKASKALKTGLNG